MAVFPLESLHAANCASHPGRVAVGAGTRRGCLLRFAVMANWFIITPFPLAKIAWRLWYPALVPSTNTQYSVLSCRYNAQRAQ